MAIQRLGQFLGQNKLIVRDLFLALFLGSVGLELKVARKELKSLEDILVIGREEVEFENITSKKATML